MKMCDKIMVYNGVNVTECNTSMMVIVLLRVRVSHAIGQ